MMRSTKEKTMTRSNAMTKLLENGKPKSVVHSYEDTVN